MRLESHRFSPCPDPGSLYRRHLIPPLGRSSPRLVGQHPSSLNGFPSVNLLRLDLGCGRPPTHLSGLFRPMGSGSEDGFPIKHAGSPTDVGLAMPSRARPHDSSWLAVLPVLPFPVIPGIKIPSRHS